MEKRGEEVFLLKDFIHDRDWMAWSFERLKDGIHDFFKEIESRHKQLNGEEIKVQTEDFDGELEIKVSFSFTYPDDELVEHLKNQLRDLEIDRRKHEEYDASRRNYLERREVELRDELKEVLARV